MVKQGDTLAAIEKRYGVPLSLLALDNGLNPSKALVPGQALVVRFPVITHTVRSGETLWSIACMYGVTLRTLFRNNPSLGGRDLIWQGQTLVISYRQEPTQTIYTNAYAYPSISDSLLFATLPFLTYITPFTYGFTAAGELVLPKDDRLIATARSMGTESLLHLSTLTEGGSFSNELSHLIFQNETARENLFRNILNVLREKGYRGLDVDFEYVYGEDAEAYAEFLRELTERLNPLGYPVLAALAPKTSADQKGALYEGHNFSLIGKAVNEVLLMTYEWGYTYGTPMAVAPLPNVRQVVEYALTEISAEQIWLGIPNYGYDWKLPYVRGETRATSISSQQAVALARQYGVSIQYDERARSPWFRYWDGEGSQHEVWFEDARSIQAKLALISEYGLRGAGYWNLMREFPQNWVVLDSLFRIADA